jgi:hypothetical protein
MTPVRVGLGPRPRAQAAARLELGTGLLDELTAADPGRRTGALQRVLDGPPGAAGAVARALATGFRARWEAVMRWRPAPGSAGQRSVQVVDTAAPCRRPRAQVGWPGSGGMF